MLGGSADGAPPGRGKAAASSNASGSVSRTTATRLASGTVTDQMSEPTAISTVSLMNARSRGMDNRDYTPFARPRPTGPAGPSACGTQVRVERSAMHFDRHESDDPDAAEAVETRPPAPIDAAESSWDPWLRALYLRELEVEHRPPLH